MQAEDINIPAVAARLLRPPCRVSQKIRVLRQRSLPPESDDSSAMLDRFLAVAEDSSVDICAATDAVKNNNAHKITNMEGPLLPQCGNGPSASMDEISLSDLSDSAIKYLNETEGVHIERSDIVCTEPAMDNICKGQTDSSDGTFAQMASQEER